MKQLSFLFLFLSPVVAFAQQTVRGKVYDHLNHMQPLQGALVAAPASGYAAYTDEAGSFWLQLAPNDSIVLVSFVGFVTDTQRVRGVSSIDVMLMKSVELKEVKIKGKQGETYISSLNPHKTDVITGAGLQKNACCSLAESFESNPSVDATTSDAVTGTKQIQMLGLSGIYVQMQTDLLPGIRGLNVITGLNDLPGPFVESIHIRKGPGSVANGFEAITGQIDVELVKPQKADRFFLNGYADTDSRMELNTYARKDFGPWSTLTMLHGSRLHAVSETNDDGFLDRPTFDRFALIHRWQRTSHKGKNTEFGVKWFYGDQQNGNVETHYDYLAALAYFVRDYNNRQEVFAKTCVAVGQKTNELGLQFIAVHHDRSLSFGNSSYKAEEITGYVNAPLQILSKDTKHTYRVGPSAYVSRYTEILRRNVNHDSVPELPNLTYNLSRNEVIPGVFAEYTYDNLKKFSVIAGVRADYAPTRALIATPRLHLRYKFTDNLVLRASAGTGWRMPHPVTENINYLISSRAVVFDDALKPEEALNYGVNLTHAYHIGERDGDWSFDAYRTQFMQQTVVDLDRSPYEIHFSNLHGQSFSNSVQLQVKQEVAKGLVVMVAGKYNDAQTTYNGTLRQKPFSPTWRGLANVSYTFWKERIKLDATAQFVGPQRIPDLAGKATNAITTSPAYEKVLGQITYKTPRWEVYAGGENLTDYRQPEPVIGGTDAFGPKFDSAMIWGPVTGPMLYAGFRFKILNK